MKKIYLFILLCVSSFALAQTPLLVEDFDYTAGDDLATKGWVAHSGTSKPILVTNPGLTFTGYVGSGIGNAAGVNNTGYDLNKSFGAQTTGTIYTSFLVNATAGTASGVYFFHYVDAAVSSAYRARTFISNATEAGKMTVGLSFNSTTPTNMTTTLNFGQTYLFVAKYEIIEGATNDKVSLYVFAEGDNISAEPATPALGPILATTTGTPPVSAPDIIPTGIALRQADAAQRITVDGFRVKTKWQLNSDLTSTLNPRSNDEINLFHPNFVTNGTLFFSSLQNQMKKINIFDATGKEVRNLSTSSNEINVNNLTQGIYFVKVQAGNSTFRSRFIIE